MRVMLLHKVTADTEAGIMPKLDMAERFREFIGEMVKAGIFRDGNGLRASSLGVRLTFAGGKRTIQEGPFVGRNEDPAALCVLKVRSRDEAVEHATRFAAALGDGECDIRPVVMPWDVGMMEKPKDDPPLFVMLVWKADPKRGGELPSPQARAALGKLIAELKAQGIFRDGDVFRASREAKRIPVTPGKRRAVDGPFAESKELISGFCTIEVPDLAAALPWAERYVALVGAVELDLRPLYEVAELV